MSWSLCWELALRNHSVAFNLVNVLLDEGICRQPFSTLWAGFWATSFFFICTAFTTLIKGRKKADRDNVSYGLQNRAWLQIKCGRTTLVGIMISASEL